MGPRLGAFCVGRHIPPNGCEGRCVPNGGRRRLAARGAFRPPGPAKQKSGNRRQSLRLPLFRARSAPPPPRRAPNGNLLPRAGVHPSAIRRLPWGRRKAGADMRGAAAFWGRGLWPRPQNMPAAGQSPAAGGWAAPTRRRPPGAGIFTNGKKGGAKARPHDLWGRAHETLAGRCAATAPRLGQSRCPRPTGSGGLNRPAAGYEPRATAPAVARRSPSA